MRQITLFVFILFGIASASIRLNTIYLVERTTYSFASVIPITGVLTGLSNFTMSEPTGASTFDDSYGTSCNKDQKIMFAGLGYGFWAGPSGSGVQRLLTIDQNSGKLFFQFYFFSEFTFS